MPPYANPYSSVLDGSLRVESSTNSDRYGKGSLIVENGCEFFGSQNQFVKSTNVNADLTIESAKNLLASAKTVTITASTGAVGINSTAGSVTLSGISASLTAITGSVSVVGGTSASLTSTTGTAYVRGSSAASVTADSGPASLIATLGSATVQAAQTIFLTGATKNEAFGNVLASSTSDYSISSTSGNAIFNANNGEARVFGKTLASVIGHQGVKIEATGGNATVKASGVVYLEGNSKTETFGTVNATSTAGNYAITSSTGKVQLNATGAAGAVELFGKTNVYVKGTDLTTIESSGTVTVVGPNVNTSATNISSTGSNSITLTAPNISLSGSTISKVEAPTVEIGKTSDTVTISRAGQDTNVQGKLTVTQHTSLSTLNTSGDCIIGGNLTVSGSVTNIDTQNLLVKDNVIVLNSADAAGRDAGMIFAATGALSTALYYKNSESAFVFSTTESSATGPALIKKDYSDIKCKNITASYITLTNFGTKEFQLDGKSSTAVTIPEIGKVRGSYEFQIESVSNGGSVYNYKIVKSGTDTGFGATGPDGFIPAKSVSSSFGVHTEGDDGSQVWVRWESNSVPEFYMKKYSKNDGMLTFRVNYITVG
jgi:hypothetical protein